MGSRCVDKEFAQKPHPSVMEDHQHQPQEQETTLSLIRYSKLLKSYSAAFDAMKKECS